MLHRDQPGTGATRIIHASLLLLGLVVAAHVIDELLFPLLPAAVAVLGVGALLLALRARRRW